MNNFISHLNTLNSLFSQLNSHINKYSILSTPSFSPKNKKIEIIESLFRSTTLKITTILDILRTERDTYTLHKDSFDYQCRNMHLAKYTKKLSDCVSKFRAIQVNFTENESMKNDKKEKLKAMVKRIGELLVVIDELNQKVKDTGCVVDSIEVKMGRCRVDVECANRQLESALWYEKKMFYYRNIVRGIIVVAVVGVVGYVVIKIYLEVLMMRMFAGTVF